VAYLMLTRDWVLTRSLEKVFVVLGQRSLGAFVLHVYGLLLLEHVPFHDGIWANTLAQVTLVAIIATLLTSGERWRNRRRSAALPQAEPLAA
jgi:OpgC protein